MAKSVICKKVISDDMSAVTFKFAHGRTLVAEVAALPAEIITRLAAFGLNHKLGDSYADAKSPEEAYEIASDLYDALKENEWNRSRQSTGGIIVEALARLMQEPLEQVRDEWKAMDEKAQKIVRKDARVAAMVAQIDLERKQKKAETVKEAEQVDLQAYFKKD